MPPSDKIAIAAHLHVLLRRKTGRVTDTEWMASNAEYAREIARFARQKAVADGHADLSVWADKLEEIMTMPETRPRVPLVKLVTDAVRERIAPPVVATTSLLHPPDQQSAKSIDTEREVFPESGFIESTFGTFFGDGEHQRKPRSPNVPQYVKGLR